MINAGTALQLPCQWHIPAFSDAFTRVPLLWSSLTLIGLCIIDSSKPSQASIKLAFFSRDDDLMVMMICLQPQLQQQQQLLKGRH
jgi:hypothetical protein